MLKTRRALVPIVGAAALAVVLAACGGSSGGKTTPPGNGGGHFGGTLQMLGVGDLDHVDSAAWYYTTDYELGNLIARQLLSYPPATEDTGATYPASSRFGETPVADAATEVPTTSNGGITNGGKTYVFHIKPGVQWNSTPPRQVTADDFIRGIARICNPIAPFGATAYFQTTIVGFNKFCNNEFNIGTTPAALKNYLAAHLKDVTGMQSSDNGMTLTFHLIKPASDFLNIVALGVASAVPVEYMKCKVDSPCITSNIMSDGPYQITSYKRAKSISLVRNPAWKRSTDDNRKAYVDKINITENLTQESVQQQIAAGCTCMEWDTFPLPQDIHRLLTSKDPNLVINPTSSSNPYIVFNTVSPGNNGALSKVAVRQAISYAVDKSAIIQDLGGPDVNTPLNQVLPPVIKGGETKIDPYPYNPTKAKAMLKAAGYPKGITVKVLYRTVSTGSTKTAQTLQSDLPKAGIHVQLVGTNNEDFYGKYLQVKPSVTRQGNWDLAIAGWGADWDGNAARTYFVPLFDGRTFAPASSNFGDFKSNAVDSLIDQALSAPTVDQAVQIWHQADVETMKEAPFVPLTNPKTANYYNSHKLAGFTYWDNYQNGDPTNIYIK
jgi:peptide/nickel transport system substrate-binding protein